MRSAFVKINQVPTKVTCWGKWIEETFEGNDSKDIVLAICGNPGITGYYEKFLQRIHYETGYNVWILSHAGHERPEKSSVMDVPCLDENHDLYNLKGQIKHKIEFVKKYVPEDARVHILAHSIGAYMTINMLDDVHLNKKVQKAYLLFPTIERMAVSRNGRIYTCVVQRLQRIIILLATFFAFLPQFFREIIGRFALFMHGTDSTFLQPTLTLSTPHIARMIMFLADDEMERVRHRNDKLLLGHQNKIYMYYGQTDGWVPLKYMEEIKRDLPGLQVELARNDFEHAFVLKSSVEIAILFSELIKTN